MANDLKCKWSKHKNETKGTVDQLTFEIRDNITTFVDAIENFALFAHLELLSSGAKK